MLPHLPLSFLFLTAGASGFPMYDMVLYPPMYVRDPFGTFNETQDWHSSTVVPIFDAQPVVAEIEALRLKYQNALDFLAGKDLVALPDALSDPGLDVLTDAVFADTTNTAGHSATDPLTDAIQGKIDIYYGPLGFGKKSQQLSVTIDTASGDLWIPVGCINCDNLQYNAAASSTYRNTGNAFKVNYGQDGTGYAEGTLAYDTISMGGLKVNNQYFGAVTDVSSNFNVVPISGRLGLSFSSIAMSGKPTFFENLIMQERVEAPFFSLHLTRGRASGSEITLGGYDMSKAAGSLTWVSVISKTYWTVHFDGVVVDGNYVSGDIDAAIDAASSFIHVPQALASSIYANIPGAGPAANYDSNFFSFPCDSNLTISLSLGGHDFGLSMRDFNLGQDGDGSKYCIGGIVGMDDTFTQGFAIIGNEFLKSWYSVYDYSHGARVGFAPSINNAQ
ncbi:aspartic peptidase domain-containing protein [Suillus clintonianus]|uniref:aspartic peptidase domain-containing protein n=1 Tax=Suillus clintonianus TaxID=1904413 RepID=UPI001B8642DB|nr:aspartic peptidase domain-containing protein [Suillus clintonianus]KAG2150906.1 aspartic peptidase domain-containing protein [Suillus clintonianus]